MKFKKTALAAALVSVAAVPVAQADVTLSGYFGAIIEGNDLDSALGGDDRLKLKSDDASVNVSATHTMNSGLEGYANIRWDGGLTDDAAIGDAIRVGVKGGFGNIRLGDTFNPIKYGQMANDALTDIGDSRYHDDVEEQGVGYEGTFGPATVGVMWSPEGNRDAVGAGVKFAFGGFNFGIGAGTASDGVEPGDAAAGPDQDLLSAGASFAIAGFNIAVAYKDFDGLETAGFTLGYGIGALSAKLTYEAATSDLAADPTLLWNGGALSDGDNEIRLDVGYDLGGGMNISTRLRTVTDDSNGDGDASYYRVMLAKTF